MSAQHSAISHSIELKLRERIEELLTQYPEAQEYLTFSEIHASNRGLVSAPPTSSVAKQVSETIRKEQTVNEFLQQVSQEEFVTVINKLSSSFSIPSSAPSTEEKLYLEQQLSDLLGFTICTELEGHQLPHLVGTLSAGQHLKRFPLDTIELHKFVPEAGLSTRRSGFGWLTPHLPLDQQLEATEQYWIGISLAELADWQSNRETTAHWWMYRKVLVVNPNAQTFVVAAVADIFASTARTQFSGSPELIRSIKCWAPGSSGRVLLFLIDDAQNAVPVGPISLDFMSPNAT